MATQIVVKESVKGKFGPQIKDAEGYLSFSKLYKGVVDFPAGTVLDAELFVSDKGKRYINSAKIADVKTPVADAKAETAKPVKTEGRNFDAENRGKTRCALLAGLLSNPSVNVNDVEATKKLISDYVGFVFG